MHEKLLIFSKTKANAYWIINNNFDFALNLPEKIYSIVTFDIMACYEAIPHFVHNGLLDSLTKVIVAVKGLGYIGFQKNKKEFKLTKKINKSKYSFNDLVSY